MKNKVKVMLTTEGTYPFHQGGVSTWCDILVNNLKNVDYTIYSIIMNPFVTQKYNLPIGSQLIKVPLWGTEEPSEHLDIPFSKVYIAKKKTDDDVIKNRFIPLFHDIIEEITNLEKNHKKFGDALFELYKYFQEYEYKKSFKSEITWEFYKNHIMTITKDPDNKVPQMGIYSIIQSLGWIYRFLNILNTPIPKVDVTHSAAAAFCGIPCVLAKLQYNTPFLLTEHGVYIREQYLSLSKRGYSPFLNDFLIRLIDSVTGLSYSYADQVSPVCLYNTRWEKRFGVDPKKIQVIYNGVDENVLKPGSRLKRNMHPTVVSVARVDPIKDQITLIKAADIVRKSIGDIRFIVYGSTTVPEYLDQCMELIRELNLDNNFRFAGHTSNIPEAYESGDIIVLSSISEAFPYSVVEAMMMGKPIISTDVGGIGEAIGDCGVLVPPQNPEELAKGIIKLIHDKELSASLAADGRDRALNLFTIEKVQEQYLNSYVRLAGGVQIQKIVPLKLRRQRLFMERGFALKESGYLEGAISQLRMALKEVSISPAVPVILTQIAEIYNRMGRFDEAFNELEKAQIIAKLLEDESIA